MTLRNRSLFSGIGGFDLGFELAGIPTVAQCEFDPNAMSVLTRHWPHVEKTTDVRLTHYSTLGPDDIICGGFPCQDVSVAGRRAGLAGVRSGLWFEFHRILKESQPGWVVIENVPGLLSSNSGRDFGVILRGLVELGYGVAWRILDAQYFGLAQRRRRVFIVGSLGSGRAAEVLFERESGAWDIAPSRKEGARVAAPVNASTPSRRNGGSSPTPDTFIAWDNGQGDPNADADGTAFSLNPQANQGVMLARSQTSRQHRNNAAEDNFVAHTLRAEGHDASEDGTGRGVPMVFQQNTRDEVRFMNGDGAIAGALSSEPGMKQQNYIANAPMVFESRYARNGRGAPDTIVPPLKAESGQTGKGDGAPLVTAFAWQQGVSPNDRSYPVRKGEYSGALSGTRTDAVSGGFGVRRLMPVECERLQGFPGGWTDGQADSARYRQLGNAVTVPVAEWIGKRIKRVHESGQV